MIIQPVRFGYVPSPYAAAARGTQRRLNLRALQFAALIFATGTLFLRFGEMFPALAEVPFYLIALMGAAALSLSLIGAQLRWSSLRERPITACVMALMAAGALSNLVRGDVAETHIVVVDFLKFVLFYLVLVGTVDTPRRLRVFLLWTTAFIVIDCALALLQYHGYIDVGAMPYREAQDQIDPQTGLPLILARLCGTGIFNNPNDLSRIIVVGVILCFYFLFDKTHSRARWWAVGWAGAIAMLGWGLQLTYSRGGFLAMLAGIGALSMAKFGRVRSILLGMLLLPVLFVVFAGRITNINTSTGTGQERIQLWEEAFTLMKGAPVLGIGVYQLSDDIGLVAHNSFVQCYVEMGVIGGTLFAGAFYLAMWGPYRLAAIPGWVDPELRRMRVYLVAIIAGVVVGMFSSTRCYRIETYLLLGIMTVYLDLVAAQVPATALRVNRALVARIMTVGIIVLALFFVYSRIAAQD